MLTPASTTLDAMRAPVRTIAIAVGLLAAASCGGDAVTPGCTDPGVTTTVVLADFEFEPECIGVDATVPITFENTGAAPHTFTIEAAGVDVDVAAGATGDASLTSLETGSYPVTCRYHPQMTATLVVG